MQLPFDDELVPLEIHDWLIPVMIAADQAETERQGKTREIKLNQGVSFGTG